MMCPLGKLVEFYAKEGFRLVQTYTERDPYLFVEFEANGTVVHHNAFPHPHGGVHVSCEHVIFDAERQGVDPLVVARMRKLFSSQEKHKPAG